MRFARLTPEDAASLVEHDTLVGFSGFTPAGAAKLVPHALARRARAEHDRGRPFHVRVITGASTGPDIDDRLADAEALTWRAPYQSSGAAPPPDQLGPGGLRRHAPVARAPVAARRLLRSGGPRRRRGHRRQRRRPGPPDDVSRADADAPAVRATGGRRDQQAPLVAPARDGRHRRCCRRRRIGRRSASTIRSRRSACPGFRSIRRPSSACWSTRRRTPWAASTSRPPPARPSPGTWCASWPTRCARAGCRRSSCPCRPASATSPTG